MRAHWPIKLVEIGVFLAIVIAGFGSAVVQLWNLLMPDLFGLHTINFWQALGLIALSWILFGGLGRFRMPGYSSNWRQRMAERYERMTPEQREELRKALESRCGRRPADPKSGS